MKGAYHFLILAGIFFYKKQRVLYLPLTYKEEVHSQPLVPFKALVLRDRRIRGMRTMVPEDEKGQPVVDCPE